LESSASTPSCPRNQHRHRAGEQTDIGPDRQRQERALLATEIAVAVAVAELV
jgi:hypothetical protein